MGHRGEAEEKEAAQQDGKKSTHDGQAARGCCAETRCALPSYAHCPALETSCDESAAAVVRDNVVLSSEVASQVAEHAQFGGVVPELASRRHVEALPVLVERALQQAQLPLSAMDAVAATVAPGLSGALLVGSVTGRSLARLAGVPLWEFIIWRAISAQPSAGIQRLSCRCWCCWSLAVTPS